MTIQDPDLHKGPAQIYGAKGFVLVKFQAVLIVEMNAPQLFVGQGIGHFIRRIQPGQNGVSRLDQTAHPAGIVGQVR